MKRKMNLYFKFLFIILVALISILIVIAKPTITLRGSRELVLDYNEKYKEPGFIATFIMKNMTDKVQVTNNVNYNKTGEYEIIYTLKINNLKLKEKRIVKIVDRENPSIELIGDGYACPDSEYKEEGYKAIDNYDGDISGKVTKIADKDKITYSVRDSSSNKASIVRNITYKDIKNPEIKLKGDNDITIVKDSEYNEPGVDVSDNCDSNIKVETIGKVDVNKPGNYKIVYKVKDNSGNESEISRNVKVVDEVKRGTGKTIYLTFDDGPSATITPKLLNILKEEKVKATFFVINHDDSLNYLIKQEHDQGHKVALHSFTHNYSYIYSSRDNYFKDLTDIRNKVHSITGEYSNIIRFPGGSSNTVSRNYEQGIMTYLTQEVVKRGFSYHDWNVSSEDAGSARTAEDIYKNVTGSLDYQNNMVLMHDFEGNYKTLDAIRDIIRYGKKNGYTFKTIDENTKPVRHSVNN